MHIATENNIASILVIGSLLHAVNEDTGTIRKLQFCLIIINDNNNNNYYYKIMNNNITTLGD